MNKKALIQAMKRSISEVLETMFFLPVKIFDNVELEELWHSGNVQITVTKLNFSGPFSGAFVLFIPEEFAMTLTANFLGKNKEKVSQANVTETSKEVINMIAGNTFTILDDHSVFDLKIPETVLFGPEMNSSKSENEFLLYVDTMGNFLALKIVFE